MQKVAKFYKVSFEQFQKDWHNFIGNTEKSELLTIYNNIKLPKRATVGSAGYDFFSPNNFILKSGEAITIPTGIRVEIDGGWVLKCYPRSGMGFKFKMQLNNTVGIIDSDYYKSDNEGHVIAKIFNDNREQLDLEISGGSGFIQGVFVPYGITFDDEVVSERNGGFGSTSK